MDRILNKTARPDLCILPLQQEELAVEISSKQTEWSW